MPRLNKVTLVDRNYSQAFVSKSQDVFIAPELEPDEQLLDINVDVTFPEVGCVNIQQDCNWFLASGVVPQTIPSCQLGIINPLLPSDTDVIVTFPGSVTYEVRPGKIKRDGFKCWSSKIIKKNGTISVPTAAAGVRNLNSTSGMTTRNVSQLVFAFKMSSSIGTQIIYDEEGSLPIGGTGNALTFYWDGSQFIMYIVNSGPFIPAYSGLSTDWHEVSITRNTLTNTATVQMDGQAVVTFFADSFINSTADLYLGEYVTSSFPFIGLLANFRLTSNIRPYSQYHCEKLTGAEPGVLAVVNMTEGSGPTASDSVTGLPYWNLYGGATWGSEYVCNI